MLLRSYAYAERLQSLGAMSLQHQQPFADMLTIYKWLHGLMDCPPAALGLRLVDSSVRGQGVRRHAGTILKLGVQDRPEDFVHRPIIIIVYIVDSCTTDTTVAVDDGATLT